MKWRKVVFSIQHRVSFGDCDPAGIMFYPHHFRLMDASFQAWLVSLGLSQAKLQKELEIIGTGLLDVWANFRAPVLDGDVLTHKLAIDIWNKKSIQICYKGFVGDQCVIEGREVRGLFIKTKNGVSLSTIEPFRKLIAESGNDHDT